MKHISILILLTILLIACQNQPSPSNTPQPAPTESINTPPSPNTPTAAAPQANNANTPNADDILGIMNQTMAALDTLQWEAHITGEFTSTTVQQIVNETTTTCTINLPNEAYCVSRELVDAPGTVGENPVELLQIGTDIYGRQGQNAWAAITGQDRPRTILLHELFQIQNGRLLFFPSDYITSAEITGQETLNNTPTTILTVQYDTTAYDLYATWYGNDVTLPDAQQTLTSKLWISPDGRLHQSESILETAVQNETTRLTLETTYGPFNQPVTIPQP